MMNVSNIKKILNSQFERELFEASLESLNDHNNKLRYNNFAYSIRELSRHFLYSLSPEENVKQCSWYKTETPNDQPTRVQRIKYAIHGGISEEILNEWEFDTVELKETIKTIKDAIDSLSRYTHINPEVFNLKEAEINERSHEVLNAFIVFVETIDSYRDELTRFLDGVIEEQMIMSVVSNFFQNVDNLAPHHSLNYSEISDYHIEEINDQEIVVSVSGNIEVTLEYGSRKDRREGDGVDFEESFPFSTKIKYEISEDFPSKNYEIVDYDVDTSSWYGEDEEE